MAQILKLKKSPIAFLHGAKNKVVPKEHVEMVYQSVKNTEQITMLKVSNVFAANKGTTVFII